MVSDFMGVLLLATAEDEQHYTHFTSNSNCDALIKRKLYSKVVRYVSLRATLALIPSLDSEVQTAYHFTKAKKLKLSHYMLLRRLEGKELLLILNLGTRWR
jgi:hypothetical protein